MAVAAPIPDDAPVTSATRPVKSSKAFMMSECMRKLDSASRLDRRKPMILTRVFGGQAARHQTMPLARRSLDGLRRSLARIVPVQQSIGRRTFLAGLGAAAVAGCRARSDGGRLILRLSHSMASGA